MASRPCTTRHRWLRVAESGFGLAGILLASLYVASVVHARLLSHSDLARFEKLAAMAAATDQGRWSDTRKQKFERSFAVDLGLPEAVLVIERIGVEVPIWEGVDSTTLNRAAGRVPGTATAGAGNTVVAAHRDGFFRRLGELREEDRLVVRTLDGDHTYAVVETLIVSPDAVEVMAPAARSQLTLITCYPFYFVGPAPQRYVVRAIEVDSSTGGI